MRLLNWVKHRQLPVLGYTCLVQGVVYGQKETQILSRRSINDEPIKDENRRALSLIHVEENPRVLSLLYILQTWVLFRVRQPLVPPF